jgi:predicted phosphodiesterase
MQCGGTRHIHYRGLNDKIKLWFLSDLHNGNAAASVKRFKQDVKEIENDPLSFAMLGGDMCDFINFSDGRFDAGAVRADITVQNFKEHGKFLISEVREWLRPIQHKIIASCYGNHEAVYQRKAENDLHAWLCVELGCLNLQYGGLFDLVFIRAIKPFGLHPIGSPKVGTGDKSSKRIFMYHGAGAAATSGGKFNRLIKTMSIEADVIFMGHVHEQLAFRQTLLAANPTCTELIYKYKLGVVSGSYLATYSEKTVSYGEMKGYSPTTLGAAKVTIIPKTGEFFGAI